MLLAVALPVVRLGHIAVYLIAASGNAALRRRPLRPAVPVEQPGLIVILAVGESLIAAVSASPTKP